MHYFSLVLLSIVSLLALSCQGIALPGMSQTSAVRVGASFGVLADIVRNVGGDRIEVVSIVPDGAELHEWEPSAQDLVRAGSLKGLVFIDAHFERFLDSAGFRQVLRDKNIPSLEYAEKLKLIEVDSASDHGDHADEMHEGDPHVWLDPRQVLEMLPLTVEFLSQIDPGGASAYKANADRYATQIRSLDTELERDFARIPQQNRRLVVFHNAYTYFAERYRFSILEVVIKNPGSEPSAREVADLRNTISNAGVKAVFKEPQFNARILEQVAADLKVPVGTLMTDSFTPTVKTYLDLMRFNRDSLVKALAP